MLYLQLSVFFGWVGKTLQDDESVPFRYNVSQMPKVNVFEPKAVPDGADMGALRASLLGSALSGHFNELPMSENCGILWEVARFVFKISVNVNHLDPCFCFDTWFRYH